MLSPLPSSLSYSTPGLVYFAILGLAVGFRHRYICSKINLSLNVDYENTI
jgi:hypothetical protein